MSKKILKQIEKLEKKKNEAIDKACEAQMELEYWESEEEDIQAEINELQDKIDNP